ncbi:PAS domain-containing sensor histidine kinase [Fulvivirga lutea]|uniref:histidine kinase n=1 Tax=Fulvivirga lutea TaxID=2810512 RepID=A0A974WJ70_9BACT|nr:PAS domain-containing sensor histidine kinase [Fulvivirga lutea]QSE96318.1 PAS domain-containing sensor histidine kinase [Fulvivirga lutea]
MRESNETAYKAIFEACEEGIIAVDIEGKIALANSSLLKLFGYEIEELLGKTIETLIPDKIRHKHVKEREVYIENPKPRKMGVGRDLLGLKKDGTQFPVEISLNKVHLDDEPHIVAFVIDISERKRVEDALQRSEEQLILYATQLEDRVSKRTEELEKEISERKKAQEEVIKALEKERELNELKSRFVSMASHEFRTPLSTILSSASLIGKYEKTDQQENRSKHIEKIKSAISNLNNILNDFLSLAKLEEGKIDIDQNQLSVICTVKEVIEEMEALKKPDQKINLEIIGEEKNIVSDEKIVKNIVINLTSNAIKYSSSNIDIITEFKPQSVQLTIKDYGIGIPANEQSHLFDRFFRAKNAINIQGTGLGLNIVKKYVEMLNGTITFESKENEGTTFTVTLPL